MPPVGPAGPDDLDDEDHDSIKSLAQLKKQISELKIPTKKQVVSKLGSVTGQINNVVKEVE